MRVKCCIHYKSNENVSALHQCNFSSIYYWYSLFIHSFVATVLYRMRYILKVKGFRHNKPHSAQLYSYLYYVYCTYMHIYFWCWVVYASSRTTACKTVATTIVRGCVIFKRIKIDQNGSKDCSVLEFLSNKHDFLCWRQSIFL